MDHNALKLDLNLQQLSIIAVALSYWKSPVIKETIRKCVTKQSSSCSLSSFISYNENIDCIAQDVIKQVKVIHVPEQLRKELEATVYLLGEKIACWIWHVVFELKVDVKYAEEMQWTCYGHVDEVKTFQSFWKKELGLYSYDSHNVKASSIYSLACILGQEQLVDKNFNLMRSILINYCKSDITIPSITNSHLLMKEWTYFYASPSKEEAVQLYKQFHINIFELDAKIMGLCASGAWFNGLKYFANKNQYPANLFYLLAKNTIFKFKNIQPHVQNYAKEAFAEIFLFLINRMPDEERTQFLVYHFGDLYLQLLHMKPYQELVLKIFDQIFDVMTTKDCLKIFKIVSYKIRLNDEDLLKKNLLGTSISRQILSKLLVVMSKKDKIKYVCTESFFSCCIRRADYLTLNIILNDDDLKVFKNNVLEVSEKVFEPFVEKGEFFCLDRFIRRILNDDEKKEYKNRFNFLEKFVTQEKYDLADKLLEWLADTDEEKIQLKMQINSAGICLSSYENKNFDINKAEKLLKWQNDGDEEQIKKIKKVITVDDLVRNEFSKLWVTNSYYSLEVSKNKCSELLNWLFEPEEMEKFKREKLIQNCSFIEVFCNHIHCPKHFETIDEIFKFCSVPPNKKKEIKLSINKKLEHWIDLFGVEKKNFRTVDSLINWVAEDEEEKESMKKRVASFYNIEELCIVTLMKCNEIFYDPILILFNSYIKPYGNIDNLILDTSIYSNGYRVIKLLKILRNEIVTPEHIKEVLIASFRS